MPTIGNIIKGINILKKYHPTIEDDWMCAEHDIIHFPVFRGTTILESDVQELLDLGFTLTKENWAVYV